MKQILTTYTFTPATGKIAFSGVFNFNASRVLSVINQTTNTMIYAQSLAGVGMSTSDSQSITLSYDTSSMSASDDLTVIYVGSDAELALKLVTVGAVDYVGEAAVGSLGNQPVWRIKKINSASGIVITWAGTGIFDQVMNNYYGLEYN